MPPAPNDLTAEEQQEFAQHGVTPESAAPPAPPEPAPTPAPPEPAPTPAPPEPVEEPTIEVYQDPETKRFISREEAFKRGIAATPKKEATPAEPATPTPTLELTESPTPPKMVPHEALHAERLKTQQMAQNMQLLQTRMNALLTARQQQGGEVTMPDMATDPVAYIQALEKRLSQFEQTRQEEVQYRQIDQGLEQDEMVFSASVPDYEQASEYYVRSRAQELLQFYPPQEAQQLLTQEARQIAQQAWQRGTSAAQMIYSLAQARGYTAGAPPAPTPAPTPAPAPAAKPKATLESIREGMAASRSLSGGHGSAAPAQLNAEAILSMSDEEFESVLALGSKGANARFAAIAGS